MYALAISVFPTCQKPKLVAINNSPKSMKKGVEKSSAFTQSIAIFNASIILI